MPYVSEYERNRALFGPFDDEEDSFGYNDSDGYDSDGYYSDGYDSEEDDTPADDDDETASAAGSLAKARLRDNDYCRPSTLDLHQNRQSFFNSLQCNFHVPDLKVVLSALNLPKSGKKVDLVNRVADHMNILLQAKNFKDLNAVIGLLNPRQRHSWASRPFATYPDPILVAEFLAKSKPYQFNIEPSAGYKIEKYVTGPVYIPIATEEAAKLSSLEFNHTGPLWNCALPKHAKQLVVLVLRIHDIKENCAEGSVKYRFSYGSKLEGLYLNGRRLNRYIDLVEDDFPYFPLQDRLLAGLNRLIVVCESKAPYYIQVVELSQDPSVKPIIPAQKVKNAFLDRSRQCDVQASSLQLSLRCPLSLVRINTPVRFETCKHLQCMELDAWISYSSNAHSQYGKNTVRPCPICNSPSSRLVIDGYFKEILAGTNEDIDMVTVDVENELKWSVHLTSTSKESISLNPEAPASIPSSPIALLGEPVMIDLYEDNTVYDSPWVQPVRVKPEPALPAQHLSTLPQTRPSPSIVDDEVVDLTSDSLTRPSHLHGPLGPPRPFVPVPEFEIIEID